MNMGLKQYQENLAKFAKERNWEQFHSPKNLSMTLSGEIGELVELFQWLTEAQSKIESLDDDTVSRLKGLTSTGGVMKGAILKDSVRFGRDV